MKGGIEITGRNALTYEQLQLLKWAVERYSLMTGSAAEQRICAQIAVKLQRAEEEA